MIDYCQPPLGYLVRVPQESLDSSLDPSARIRAEEAARFLSYERLGQLVSLPQAAAVETAEGIACSGISCSGNEAGQVFIDEKLEEADVLCGYLRRGELPCVLVTSARGIRAAIERLSANVCEGLPDTRAVRVVGQGEIVAPGGIISVHRQEDGGIALRARTMVLDFAFTDFVEAVSAGA